MKTIGKKNGNALEDRCCSSSYTRVYKGEQAEPYLVQSPYPPHDSKQSFRSNVRSFNPLLKRGCQGRPAPDRGPGVSPGSFPFSRAACGAQKERKGVFRGLPASQAGFPEPRQRAAPFAIPLLELVFKKLALCHVSGKF